MSTEIYLHLILLDVYVKTHADRVGKVTAFYMQIEILPAYSTSCVHLYTESIRLVIRG